ncbi:MAG TPA: hypothetical protein PK671_24925 [Candidatus Obscuribacter sp.]|nr:hypothetical protein [Candidatus Obscuribacter sp.]HMY56236.1 hypothetical protein [Candidatus Obscuribacter sp.]
MKILIIEDSLSMAITLSEALERQGHEVTWLTGVVTLAPFVGTVHGGKARQVDPRQFDLLIEDGELKGSPYQGEQIVEYVSALNVACIGNSTLPEVNQEMAQKGALLVVRKPILLAAAQAGFFQPEQVKSDLSGLTAKLNVVEETARDRTDPQLVRAWQEVEARLKVLMKEELGL